jgi:hypothetical protein
MRRVQEVFEQDGTTTPGMCVCAVGQGGTTPKALVDAAVPQYATNSMTPYEPRDQELLLVKVYSRVPRQ